MVMAGLSHLDFSLLFQAGMCQLMFTSSKMNRTLFDCGFHEKVELRSADLYNITERLHKAVKLKYDSIRCGICSQSFSGKQYLDQHLRFKHPECSADDGVQEGSDQSTSLQISSTPFNDVQEIEGTIARDDSSRTTKGESRRGSSNRKSHTIEFKKQTLDLLDSMSNAKSKWQKVAEAKQTSKCLVIKWNKARDKIFAEVARNKRKANSGGVREARLRRKVVAKRPETAKDTRLQ